MMDDLERLTIRGRQVLEEGLPKDSGEIDLDVSVADLERLVALIRAEWVGGFPDREEHPRAGTIYVSPDGWTIRLALRFPLKTEILAGLLAEKMSPAEFADVAKKERDSQKG